MKILNINVSENATRHIKRLSDSFSKPVRFFPVEENPDKSGAGRSPAKTENAEYYSVYLSRDLDKRIFEANALYELFYIIQFESNFPALCNKKQRLFYEDGDFVEDLGRSLFTGILDIEIYDRLRECGYSDVVNTIADNVYNGLISNASNIRNNLDDKYSYANLVITFAKVLFHTNREQDDNIKTLFGEYPFVLERSFSIRDSLRENHPDTPDSAVLAMGGVIDMFNLWDLFYIQTNKNRIRTKSEYNSFVGLRAAR